MYIFLIYFKIKHLLSAIFIKEEKYKIFFFYLTSNTNDKQ